MDRETELAVQVAGQIAATYLGAIVGPQVGRLMEIRATADQSPEGEAIRQVARLALRHLGVEDPPQHPEMMSTPEAMLQVAVDAFRVVLPHVLKEIRSVA